METQRKAIRGNESVDAVPAASVDPFVQPFLRGLRAFVGRRVPERDADDVAQDVLLRLHRGLNKLRDPSRWESWAFGIARRTIADYYRSRRPGTTDGRGGEIETVEDPNGGGPRGFGRFEGDHSVHEEVLGWLRPTAESLPAKYRDALLLADFDGHTQKEVAVHLGLSLSGAKSRVQRARALLADAVQRCCEVALNADGEAVDFRRLEEDEAACYGDCGCQ
ncbi:MAG: sigma-70 family RNA polymerase sigma factor [Thermoanaerobaculia bacterium]|nr:sigma-70 family RNA polymerase sigma factor [Thermoanaerobaculia bacterium]